MSNALFRMIVGPVMPLRPNEEVPTPYHLSASPQMQVKGSLPSEPSEANQPITENTVKTPSFPS